MQRSPGPVGAKVGLVRAEDPQRNGRLRRGSPPRRRPQNGEGPRRRSSACRRSPSPVPPHGGHVSHFHLWGTEIFVNHKTVMTL
jgi:hypothetical protein